MITCKQCKCQFFSTWSQGYPGAVSTCGSVVFWSVFLFLVALVLATYGVLSGEREYFVMAVFAALGSILKALSYAETRKVLLAHGGNKCPDCGAENDLRWYD